MRIYWINQVFLQLKNTFLHILWFHSSSEENMFYFTTVSQSRNKETPMDMSVFESDTPGRTYGSNALNIRSPKKVSTTSVSQPTNKDTAIDMSIFESDTPGRNYGSNALNIRRANKGTIPVTLLVV